VPLEVHIRLASEADIPVLTELIDASVRGLQKEDYSPAQIDNALKTVFGVDSQLIADGTYFVAEARKVRVAELREPRSGFAVAGCGGWSKRRKLYGGDSWTAARQQLLDPAVDAAKIRAFFISPDWARLGIGSSILDACEAAAVAAGFRRFEMGATLTGVKLFRARGYLVIDELSLPIGGGLTLPVVHMEKRLAAAPYGEPL
jgi:N-acetylglutamate synthase-like GNAT family acetyltransferase